MLGKNLWVCAVAATLGLPAGGRSEPSDRVALAPIVVDGSRLKQTATEFGSSVTVLTARDIEELGVDFALDAVAAAPGVTIHQNGAYGGAATARIRGASSGQTLVLVDGVPVNDPASPGGGFNFAHLDAGSIERIEVLKGPQSTLWGSDAIGGVVSIATKRAAAGSSGEAFGKFGSFDTFRGGISAGHQAEEGEVRLTVAGMSSDGISKAEARDGNPEEDGYDVRSLAIRGGLRLGGDARLSAAVRWSDSETEYDGFGVDADNLGAAEELSARLSLGGVSWGGSLENLLVAGYSGISREDFSDGMQSFEAEGDRVIYRYQGVLDIDGEHTLSFGAERDTTRADIPSSGVRDVRTSIHSLFALHALRPNEHLTLTGGVRRDDHDRFGGEVTGRVAVAYHPVRDLTLRSSWGEGFKAPTIFQTTYRPTFCGEDAAPNPDLEAETAEAVDAGVDWRSPDGRVDVGLTWFRQRTRNQIGFDCNAGGYANIAEVESRGVELDGAYRFAPGLTVALQYAYVDARKGDGGAVARIPMHSGDLRISLDPDGPFSGALLVRYNDSEPNGDGTMLDNWVRVDLAGRYRLNERMEVFGRIENLFDAEYQQVSGYGTPGLSGSLGVRLAY